MSDIVTSQDSEKARSSPNKPFVVVLEHGFLLKTIALWSL